MSFVDLYKEMQFDSIAPRIARAPFDSSILRRIDSMDSLDSLDLLALLSPAAQPYLEDMAQLARSTTRQRFGRVMQMYAPMYLSNECRSSCTYCGFSFENNIRRRTLSLNEIQKEAEVLYSNGIRHILLLTGEDYKNTSIEYLAEACALLSKKFPSISIEVYPLKEEEYLQLRSCGVDGLAVYQETYDPKKYAEVHFRGMKKRLEYRLDCPDRAGRAGLRRIAIGALLGLSDPATEVYFVAMHAKYLMKTYWNSQLSISLPRLRPAEGLNDVPHISDKIYAQYFFALRLFLPDVGLTMSTRESANFRDSMADICITQMSAGSKTDPGGYNGGNAQEQFAIDDERSVSEVSSALRNHGLEPVFVDWSPVLK